MPTSEEANMRQGTLEAALLDVVGKEDLVTGEGLASYSVDGRQPQAAVRPASVAQVSEVMALAHRLGLAVIPWGGGTMMGVGNVPTRYHLALDLRRLDRLVEHEPADLTLTVQAGMTVACLQEALAPHGQMVPLDPPWPRQATIGGTLATAVAGPARCSLGLPRDVTIGIKVVMADGRVTKAGGKVVKNVAGYDLCKLYVGSMGTLAVIVEASFKLLPLPRTRETRAFAFPAPMPAWQAATEAWRRHLALGSLYLQWQGGPYTLVVRLTGIQEAVDRSLTALAAIAQGLGGEVTDVEERWEEAMISPAEARGLTMKLSVSPSRVPACLEGLAKLSPSLTMAMPLAGVCYARWPEAEEPSSLARKAMALAEALEGVAVIHACEAALKEEMDVFGPLPPSFHIMKAVKERWDPRGNLSPGRFLGRW
jgi:glycolate oxidase FAD binding subunit